MSLSRLYRSEMAQLMLAGFLIGSAALAVLPSTAQAPQSAPASAQAASL